MDKVQEGLRHYFSHVHPLVFSRSVEKARSNGELFDILQEIPKRYPIFWHEESRRWVFTEDLLQNDDIEGKTI